MIRGYGELGAEADPCWDDVVKKVWELEALMRLRAPESRELDLALTRLEESAWWFRSALLQTPWAYYEGRAGNG